MTILSTIRKGLSQSSEFFAVLIMCWPIIFLATVVFALLGIVGWTFWGETLSSWLVWSAGSGFVLSMCVSGFLFPASNVQ